MPHLRYMQVACDDMLTKLMPVSPVKFAASHHLLELDKIWVLALLKHSKLTD